ncbi:hypothetical protein KIW84_030081 [Lathyrus oleraceus]|uniref:Uncharacterized protein n=1 Tax=Pisum sativum TaxID=3888 RepID=A0A9D4XMF2_PEA|nr:hypothetical protein KIW84_030081 [Pisum sativum]
MSTRLGGQAIELLHTSKLLAIQNGGILDMEMNRAPEKEKRFVSYSRHLKKIWNELSTYITKITCTCEKCVCKWAMILSKECEDERVHQFLMGLNDDLNGILLSNIIAQDLLPSLNRVYSLVVQEERHKTIPKRREARKMSCLGTASYFKIIGYPEWWNIGRGNGKRAGKGKGIVDARKGTLGVANVSQFGTTSFSASPVLTTQ